MKDHGNLTPADGAHLTFRRLGQILALTQHRSAGDLSRRIGHKAQERQRQHGKRHEHIHDPLNQLIQTPPEKSADQPEHRAGGRARDDRHESDKK
ncbi:hypothetical protein [Antarctobacter sp.]|uniref:hypothetical protein n=1 Tax=Antarctobacter sp. TaxID=1872577 RepID=UPI003A909CC0